MRIFSIGMGIMFFLTGWIALAEPTLPLIQKSPDITLVSANFSGSHLYFQDGKMWIDSSSNAVPCSIDQQDRRGKIFNCTSQLEAMVQMPVWMPIRFKKAQQFSCQVLNLITVSRADALNAAEWIGFFYRPNSVFAGADFGNEKKEWVVTKKSLKVVGESKMLNALNGVIEKGIMHQFTGLAGCWEGDASLTTTWQTVFQPYMAFDDERARKIWKNVDMGGEYRVSLDSRGLDRSSEVLR